SRTSCPWPSSQVTPSVDRSVPDQYATKRDVGSTVGIQTSACARSWLVPVAGSNTNDVEPASIGSGGAALAPGSREASGLGSTDASGLAEATGSTTGTTTRLARIRLPSHAEKYVW